MKQCIQCNSDFEILPADRTFYEKMDVCDPVRCPDCRHQQRVAWRNERTLYPNVCGLCKKQVVSIYSPEPPAGRDKPLLVYCQECWWSDAWDPISYGIDIDANKSFFEQFKDLQTRVPYAALMNSNSENSAYTNYTGNNRNCYLIFSNGYGHNEDCQYGTMFAKDRNCIDGIKLEDCELCYGCVDCTGCFHVACGQMCFQCTDSYFIEDCRNCSNCFMCKGLRNKQYCILNIQYSKDEYEKKVKEYNLQTRSGWRRAQTEFDQFRKSIPSVYSFQLQAEQCTGDYIIKSSECTNCFDATDTENCRYLQYSVNNNRDVQDCSYTGGLELGLEVMGCVGGYRCIGSTIVWWDVANLDYCAYMFNGAQDCFGCIGLRGKKWCILNKQYTEEEYKRLRNVLIEKIKQEGVWGHFFPPELSFFGYNETVAQDYFPLTKEEALRLGYHWNDRTPGSCGKGDIDQKDIPDSIEAVADDILQKTLTCEKCQKNYKLVKQEFDFYRRQNIPIPSYCFHCRHLERLSRRRPRKLWVRQCMCEKSDHGHGGQCTKEFETSYSSDREDLVYCEECYQNEIA